MGASAEGAKTETYVETRFAHGTITLVIVGGVAHHRRLQAPSLILFASFESEARPSECCSFRLIRFAQVFFAVGRALNVRKYLAIVWIVHHGYLWDWPLAVVKIAR